MRGALTTGHHRRAGEDVVKRRTTLKFGLSTAALMLLSAGCGSMNPAMTMTGLQAKAQSMANGMEMQLTGQFQTEPQG